MSKPIRIILLGPRNVGKSSAGHVIEQKTGLKFIDIDDPLVKQYGPIPEIVKEYGWEWFRKIETRIVEDIVKTNKQQDIIIGLGGGTVAHEFTKWRKKNISILNNFNPTAKVLLIPYPDHRKNAEILTKRSRSGFSGISTKPPLTDLGPLEETYFLLLKRFNHYLDFSTDLIYTRQMGVSDVADAIIERYLTGLIRLRA
ncbi:MAG TPA: shikimate kinase [Bacteroidales bacterium]|nr:shikimate kinase [Bacteroidales bacterium]